MKYIYIEGWDVLYILKDLYKLVLNLKFVDFYTFSVMAWIIT